MLARAFADRSGERGLLFQIAVDIGKKAPDHGAGDRKIKPFAVPDGHDLRVLAPGRTVIRSIPTVKPPFDGEHETLERAQRRMADPK